MLTSLLSLLSARHLTGSAIDHVLPRMIGQFGADFRRFADCGAGIGGTALAYAGLLRRGLTEEQLRGAAVYAYEPLPENLAELGARVRDEPLIRVRDVAVSNAPGVAKFTVPRRMTGSAATWGEGTSALGYLGAAETGEVIEVKVARLADEAEEPFDFVKLDLQGGERNALIGLGNRLQQAKLVYAEHQFYASPDTQALSLLQDNGFLCFFDKVQFGYRGSNLDLPMHLLREAGIEIEQIRLADGRGLNNIFWGRVAIERTARLRADGQFDPDLVKRMYDAGLYYMQTDVLAVHHSVQRRFLALF